MRPEIQVCGNQSIRIGALYGSRFGLATISNEGFRLTSDPI